MKSGVGRGEGEVGGAKRRSRRRCRVSWTGTTTSSSAGAGALMNILLQKFAMSTGATAAGGGKGGGEWVREGCWKSFSAHFIAFHFAAVTQGLPKRKLSAQFEILLRQVFPSITQRGCCSCPLPPVSSCCHKSLKWLSHLLPYPLPLLLLLLLPQVIFLLPNACPTLPCTCVGSWGVHGGNPVACNPFAVWRVSAAVVLA